MGNSPLVGFLELDGGSRIIELCGPTLATRLSQTCAPLLCALPWSVIKELYASLVLPPHLPVDASATLLDAEIMANSAPHANYSMHLAAPLLRALFGILAGPPSQRDMYLDELCVLLARGTPPGSAAMYALAVRQPGLANFIERFKPEENRLAKDTIPALPSVDKFYDDIFASNLAPVVHALAAGMDVNVRGDKIFNGDIGCCCWSPLAAAVSSAGRRTNGHIIAALLMVAKADPNRPCDGPCGLTPLMLAAHNGGAAVCALLVRAGADVRIRHRGHGNTAMDMGNEQTSHAIRAERDARGERQVKAEKEAAPAADAKPSCKPVGTIKESKARGAAPNLRFLVSASAKAPVKPKGDRKKR